VTADPRPRRALVKICGLTESSDAVTAERHGADFLGFVLSTGFGRSVSSDRIDDIAAATSARRVAVLVDEPVDRATELARRLGAAVVQLHGSEPASVVRRVRDAGPWQVWKAIRAGSLQDVADAVLHYGDIVDGFLVEGRKPGVVGGGGVGLTLDPTELRARLPVDRDFVLAGGLTPDSVQAAVERYRPHVVDVSSGVEVRPGAKDEEAVRRFIHHARLG